MKVDTTNKIVFTLYFRSFRSVGDEIFIKAFEDATLPYEDWTHEAHLRMAWTYITEYGKEKATPFIRWVKKNCKFLFFDGANF